MQSLKAVPWVRPLLDSPLGTSLLIIHFRCLFRKPKPRTKQARREELGAIVISRIVTLAVSDYVRQEVSLFRPYLEL